MTTRRSVLAAGATAGVALTAGCLDFVLGNAPLEFDAQMVRPTDDQLEESAYEELEADWERITEAVTVGGAEREISASVWASTYSKTVEVQGERLEAALFAAVSLPKMEVLGRPLNPILELSNEELLAEFQGEFDGQYGQLDDLQRVDDFGLPILGAGRTVDVFTTETDVDGEVLEITLFVSSFAHDGDVIVLLGGFPELLPEEGVNIELLMESVEHPLS